MTPTEPVLLELLAAVAPPFEAPAAAPRPRGRRRQPERHRKCTFDLPASLARDFKRICGREGLTQRDVVEHLLRAWVADRLLP